MQNRIVFLLIGIFPILAFSQQKSKGIVDAKYECVWSVRFIDDTLKMIPGIEDRIILLKGDNVSYQENYLQQQRDSTSAYLQASLMTNPDAVLEHAKTQIDNLRNSTNLRENGTHRYSSLHTLKLYKDYKAKKIKEIAQISTNHFTYEEILLPQNWEIREDTMTIAGYACQKAVCDYRGRSYEAWFASEIPISEGPWKFYGLPGLIIRLNDTQRHYEFDLVEFKSTNKTIDTNVLTTNKIDRLGKTEKLTKIDRKKLLSVQWGKQGGVIKKAEMEKIGFSYTPSIRNHAFIERDF